MIVSLAHTAAPGGLGSWSEKLLHSKGSTEGTGDEMVGTQTSTDVILTFREWIDAALVTWDDIKLRVIVGTYCEHQEAWRKMCWPQTLEDKINGLAHSGKSEEKGVSMVERLFLLSSWTAPNESE